MSEPMPCSLTIGDVRAVWSAANTTFCLNSALRAVADRRSRSLQVPEQHTQTTEADCPAGCTP